jgi:hypothetical protein
MWDRNKHPKDNTMNILNDLERGQNNLVRGESEPTRGKQQIV